jgi:hypothetical protein
MTDREYALKVLAARRETASMVFAQEAAVADLERLGQRVSPRVLAGAVKDAGGLDGYASLYDYQLAIGEFIEGRRRHARRTFDLSGLSR